MQVTEPAAYLVPLAAGEAPFDCGALERYLAAHLPDVTRAATWFRFEGGQSNPTFLLQSGTRRYVLRKKPAGTLLPTAHMVEREYRVCRALEGSAVPVPAVRHLCEDASIIGTPFFVMDYIEGRTLRDPALPDATPEHRSALYADMARVLAALHAVDYAARGLSDFGKPGNYFRRQIERWTKQYLAAKTDEIEAMNRLMEWLPAHIPDDDQTTLVHGDYQLYNLLLHPTEPRILAVLDWELSTLGHPLADLAYSCVKYHNHEAETLTRGVPSEAEYVAAYCRASGRTHIDHWPFYLAFAFFRSASIGQGVYMRGLRGNAASTSALERGRKAAQHAEYGFRVIAG